MQIKTNKNCFQCSFICGQIYKMLGEKPRKSWFVWQISTNLTNIHERRIAWAQEVPKYPWVSLYRLLPAQLEGLVEIWDTLEISLHLVTFQKISGIDRLCIGWNQSPHVGRQKYWAEHEKRWPRPFARSWHWASTEQNNCHCAADTSQSPPSDKAFFQKLRKHGLLFVWMYLHLVFILRYCTSWHIHWQKSTTRRQRRSSGGGWWWWRRRCWRWGKSWSTRPLKGGRL